MSINGLRPAGAAIKYGPHRSRSTDKGGQNTMQQSWINTLMLMLLLACAGGWLSLVRADEEEAPSMSLTEVVDLVEPLGQGCEAKPERSHIEEMVLNKEDASHESKCFRRCMLRQFEIMAEGQSQFDETKTVEMMNMMFPDKDSESKTIVGKCNQIVTGAGDECEASHSISMCMLREMRTASYKIPEIKE